ncbi:MAG: GDSL-type esterase/lipase family protein [Planctomycetaceae bacterium]
MHTFLSTLRCHLPTLVIGLGLATAGLRAEEKPSASPPSPAPTFKFPLPATDDGIPGAGPLRRQEWFQKRWDERRTDFASHATEEQGALVFLGDSITQGWGNRLAEHFPEAKLANRGIGGDTTRGMLLRLADDVLNLQPSGVVLLMGTNDLEMGAEPAVIAGNVKLIIDALKAHNADMPIVLCQVFPSSAKKKRPAEKIKTLNKLCQDLVKGDQQVTVLDTWTLFANTEGDARPEEFPDLLHPNAVGYAKWSSALRPILATLGFLETGEDDFTPETGAIVLFNGEDLTGWGFRDQKTLTPQANFDGQTASSDGRYIALHDRIVVKTPSEGRKVQQMWTTQEFPKDFTLKLEFRATPNADSGVFIRKPQLQCRDYPLAGPYKELQQYKPQGWNELVIKVTGDVARCTCNGEVLEAEFQLPETGPIGLEGDRGQMEYRRIRLIPAN